MDQAAMSGLYGRKYKGLVAFILLCSILFIMVMIYGIIAHFLLIPDYKVKVRLLETRIETQQEIIKMKDLEIRKLKEIYEKVNFQLRWDKFLQLMLDKDTKIRFDHVEKYLKVNKVGLFEKIGG